MFSGNLADGYGLLFDSKYRFAGDTIQNVHIADLAGLREERNLLSLDCDVEQYGSRRQIEVPLVVVHSLEIPLQLSGLCLERDDRISEEIVSFAVAAVVVAGRTAKHGVEKTALGVERHVEAPVVDAGAVLPAVAVPRIVADFAGLGHRMEFPDLLAGERVEGARVAGLARPLSSREHWRQR